MEIGGAWIGGLKIYPLINGVSPTDLPGPLRQLSCCTVPELKSKLLPALEKLEASFTISEPTVRSQSELRALASSVCVEITITSSVNALSDVIADALSGERSTRRLAHTAIQGSSWQFRLDFLAVMKRLTGDADDRIRGEAYYCLGYIHISPTERACSEEFLAQGLEDESIFVRACCANALSQFTPLLESTLAKLQETLSLYAYRTQTSEQVTQLVYYSSNTIRQNLIGSDR
ncbi:hypothetical protein GCM10009836_20430 [Pseudonocardia ailaonensis]|uniref:HEAT repeat protein n=2 Tax=Pseudonocardia ailaonensis TaxID=367279 RepID=A0ABN2MYX6_9PSEU